MILMEMKLPSWIIVTAARLGKALPVVAHYQISFKLFRIPMLKFSIIIPVLNEAEHIESALKQLQVFRDNGHQLIVIDGGSSDATEEISRNYSDKIILSDRGRAKQMNAGANVADGEVLIFLHADTVLPVDACELINSAMTENYQWGRFNVRLSGERKFFRVIEFFINWRSRLSSIATGDQAIFVSKKLFDDIGGFPDIPLMEDVAISKYLKHRSNPICLRKNVITSSRRWEQRGVLKTVLLMWRLRFLYFIGVSPNQLVKYYR